MFSSTHLGKAVNVSDQLIEQGVNVVHLENWKTAAEHSDGMAACSDKVLFGSAQTVSNRPQLICLVLTTKPIK